MSGHVLGLFYFDAKSGQSVRLATVKSTVGEILPGNELVYRDCFDGLTADLKYRYESGLLEQDIVIRANPVPPSALGLEDGTTRIEVITEWLEGRPTARRERIIKRLAEGPERQAMAEPDWKDEWIDFGAMQMVNGRAFRTGHATTEAAQNSHQVGKTWKEINGRKLVIESVEYETIAKELTAMNAPSASPGEAELHASRQRMLPNPALDAAIEEGMLLAASPYDEQGLVIDYILVQSTPNLYLGNLETFVVEGWVTVSQSLTIYDGAIVKYAPGAKITNSSCKPDEGSHQKRLNPEFIAAYLPTIIQGGSRFLQRIDRLTNQTIETNDIALIQMAIRGSWPLARVTLKSGCRFALLGREVYPFDGAGALWNPPPEPIELSKLRGEWRLSEREALKRARDAVQAAGFDPKELGVNRRPVSVVKPFTTGSPYLIPRYQFRWERSPRKGLVTAMTTVEINGETGELEGITVQDFTRALKPLGIAAPILIEAGN